MWVPVVRQVSGITIALCYVLAPIMLYILAWDWIERLREWLRMGLRLVRDETLDREALLEEMRTLPLPVRSLGTCMALGAAFVVMGGVAHFLGDFLMFWAPVHRLLAVALALCAVASLGCVVWLAAEVGSVWKRRARFPKF